MKHKIISLTLITLIFVAVAGYGEVRRSTLDKRLVRSAESFENVINSQTGAIPPSILARAQGILIFREWGAGFWIGGKGGNGVAMHRGRDGRWGSPAFLKAGEGSFGLQIGVQRMDMVFLFMNESSMKVFENPKFRIGVDAAAAAGPVGANAEAKIGAPVLVYSDNAGLYAGAAFAGGFLLPDNEANEVYYRMPGITVPEIIYGRPAIIPPAAESLKKMIEDYESRDRGYNSQNRRNQGVPVDRY